MELVCQTSRSAFVKAGGNAFLVRAKVSRALGECNFDWGLTLNEALLSSFDSVFGAQRAPLKSETLIEGANRKNLLETRTRPRKAPNLPPALAQARAVMADRRGFEPRTCGLGGRRPILARLPVHCPLIPPGEEYLKFTVYFGR